MAFVGCTRIDAMTAQTWNSELYEKNARFVSDLGAPVLERLAARAGEDILDLGCADGVLTRKIAGLSLPRGRSRLQC